MAGPLITLGDKTSHGGTFVEASSMSDTGGKGSARVGDKATCPIPGHGNNQIASDDRTLIIDGKPAARHGDKTACGATPIAAQQASIDKV
ncbi:PAAR domain-containing protein [[Empedobacter] haloabium]|uniref:PAAR domain-containing protein n=1 Tax=[Empedobacter] haloabium TaxID=592317 RepID=A0ABZ1UTA9_9BURK